MKRKFVLLPITLTTLIPLISVAGCAHPELEIYNVKIDPGSDTADVDISTPQIMTGQELVIPYEIITEGAVLDANNSWVKFHSSNPISLTQFSYENNKVIIPASQVTTSDITICLKIYKVKIDSTSDTTYVNISTPAIVLNKQLTIHYEMIDKKAVLDANHSWIKFDSSEPTSLTSFISGNNVIIPDSLVTTYNIAICLTIYKVKIDSSADTTYVNISTPAIALNEPLTIHYEMIDKKAVLDANHSWIKFDSSDPTPLSPFISGDNNVIIPDSLVTTYDITICLTIHKVKIDSRADTTYINISNPAITLNEQLVIPYEIIGQGTKLDVSNSWIQFDSSDPTPLSPFISGDNNVIIPDSLVTTYDITICLTIHKVKIDSRADTTYINISNPAITLNEQLVIPYEIIGQGTKLDVGNSWIQFDASDPTPLTEFSYEDNQVIIPDNKVTTYDIKICLKVHRVKVDSGSDTTYINISNPAIALDKELVIPFEIISKQDKLDVSKSWIQFDLATPSPLTEFSCENNQVIIPANKVTTYNITIHLKSDLSKKCEDVEFSYSTTPITRSQQFDQGKYYRLTTTDGFDGDAFTTDAFLKAFDEEASPQLIHPDIEIIDLWLNNKGAEYVMGSSEDSYVILFETEKNVPTSVDIFIKMNKTYNKLFFMMFHND